MLILSGKNNKNCHLIITKLKKSGHAKYNKIEENRDDDDV